MTLLSKQDNRKSFVFIQFCTPKWNFLFFLQLLFSWYPNQFHVTIVNDIYLSFGWQGFNLLDEEGVRFDHDNQRYACCLLHTAHKAWMVHDLRPLAQCRRHLTAATIGALKTK